MKVIAVVNQKGGVGKTVSTVNIAVGLARKGKRVLAIDLDPQGSLTVSFGEKDPDSIPITVNNILENIMKDIEFDVSYAVMEHKEGIQFVPSNLQLAGVDMQLMNSISRESILKEYTKRIAERYDYIVIDCSPSLGLLTVNALACADEVVIPVQAQYLSMKGMEQLLDSIKKIKKKINMKLEIAGILITMVDNRTTCAKELIQAIRRIYDRKINVFQSTIPMSVKVTEMSISGESIFEYDPQGKVAQCYESVVAELLLHFDGGEQ
ncbi:MAG: ParA family protein [Bacillota bacterium]